MVSNEVISRMSRAASPVLGEDQLEAITQIATSGRVLDVVVGPAGAGKTSTMRALRQVWEHSYGTDAVVGLAPSACAAEVLSEELGIATENTAKWWHDHITHESGFSRGQLVIIDEASLAGTLTLDRITGIAASAGAKVLLVGAYAQLQAVDAGGAFGLLARRCEDVAELVNVRRFAHAWESEASLDLRHGRVEAIDTYQEHGRITDGDTETMLNAAYVGWKSDQAVGRSSILIADSTESVTALNSRARADLIIAGIVRGPREATLHDGTQAAIGDTVITRRNDRRIQVGRGWVRNGDRWNVVDVRHDGSLLVRRTNRSPGGKVLLSASYVAEHVELGHAVTAHRAQGITVDAAHVLVDASATRESFYVSMTRGRHQNNAYVAVDRPDDGHADPLPADAAGETARSVLTGVLQNAGAEISAHEALVAEQDRWGTIAQLAAEYDTIAAVAQRDRWVALILTSGLSAEAASSVVASDAFGPLTAELRRSEAQRVDVDALLPRLVAARPFDDADDIAAVLRHRVAAATARFAQSGRLHGVPRLITGLIPEAAGPVSSELRQSLDERRDLIEQRADAVLDAAMAKRAPWVSRLGVMPTDHVKADQWRRNARTVAAYRDQYGVTSDNTLGPQPKDTNQRADYARSDTALRAVSAIRVHESNRLVPVIKSRGLGL